MLINSTKLMEQKLSDANVRLLSLIFGSWRGPSMIHANEEMHYGHPVVNQYIRTKLLKVSFNFHWRYNSQLCRTAARHEGM